MNPQNQNPESTQRETPVPGNPQDAPDYIVVDSVKAISPPSQGSAIASVQSTSPAGAPTDAPSASPIPADADSIHTRDLIKRFGQRTVVNNVNLSVRAGEIVGLLGPNGAGKTTTFYIIVGLIKATSGKVFLNGKQDITRVPMYRRARLGLGYLPQEPSVLRRLTVEENIRAVAETLHLKRKDRNTLVERYLHELNLEAVARQHAYTLSGGERRRLEISRALVTRPSFLLMDEPFSGVDPINVKEVQDIVSRLKHRGIGILITDHNVRETLRIVDRAYLLHEGKVLCEGTSEALISDPQSKRFYLGEDFRL